MKKGGVQQSKESGGIIRDIPQQIANFLEQHGYMNPNYRLDGRRIFGNDPVNYAHYNASHYGLAMEEPRNGQTLLQYCTRIYEHLRSSQQQNVIERITQEDRSSVSTIVKWISLHNPNERIIRRLDTELADRVDTTANTELNSAVSIPLEQTIYRILEKCRTSKKKVYLTSIINRCIECYFLYTTSNDHRRRAQYIRIIHRLIEEGGLMYNPGKTWGDQPILLIIKHRLYTLFRDLVQKLTKEQLQQMRQVLKSITFSASPRIIKKLESILTNSQTSSSGVLLPITDVIHTTQGKSGDDVIIGILSRGSISTNIDWFLEMSNRVDIDLRSIDNILADLVIRRQVRIRIQDLEAVIRLRSQVNLLLFPHTLHAILEVNDEDKVFNLNKEWNVDLVPTTNSIIRTCIHGYIRKSGEKSKKTYVDIIVRLLKHGLDLEHSEPNGVSGLFRICLMKNYDLLHDIASRLPKSQLRGCISHIRTMMDNLDQPNLKANLYTMFSGTGESIRPNDTSVRRRLQRGIDVLQDILDGSTQQKQYGWQTDEQQQFYYSSQNQDLLQLSQQQQQQKQLPQRLHQFSVQGWKQIKGEELP